MLSKRYKTTEVDCRTWLHVPSGTTWSNWYLYQYAEFCGNMKEKYGQPF